MQMPGKRLLVRCFDLVRLWKAHKARAESMYTVCVLGYSFVHPLQLISYISFVVARDKIHQALPLPILQVGESSSYHWTGIHFLWVHWPLKFKGLPKICIFPVKLWGGDNQLCLYTHSCSKPLWVSIISQSLCSSQHLLVGLHTNMQLRYKSSSLSCSLIPSLHSVAELEGVEWRLGIWHCIDRQSYICCS